MLESEKLTTQKSWQEILDFVTYYISCGLTNKYLWVYFYQFQNLLIGLM